MRCVFRQQRRNVGSNLRTDQSHSFARSADAVNETPVMLGRYERGWVSP
jgi:hypothetical protein